MTRDDIQELKTPLMVFAAVLVVTTALVWYSGSVSDGAHQRLLQQETQLKQMRLRIQNAGEEKEMIGRYLTGYRQLEQAGFVGDEQRINWLDALRMANQQSNIFGVEYEISVQRTYAHAAELNPGPLALKESVMKLKLRLLHEEDLARFFQALGRQGGGFFTVDQCVLRRTKPGEVDPSRAVQANLLAECDVSWVTAKPGTAEKKS